MRILLRLKPLAKLLCTVGIVIYVCSYLDFHLLWQGLQKISIRSFLLVSLFCFLSSFSQATRWSLMVKNQLSVSFWRQIIIFWKASFLNLITPASLGGDIYRIVSSRKQKESNLAFGFIIRERLLGLLGISLSYLLFLIIFLLNNPYKSLHSFFLTAGLIALLSLCLLFLLQLGLPKIASLAHRFLSAKYKERILQLNHALHYQSIQECIVLVTLSMLSVVIWVLVFFILGNTISSTSITLEKLGLISIMTEMSRWIPLTIQGAGIREGVAAYSFKLMGQPLELGALIAGLAYCINTIVLTCVGLIGFLVSTWLPYEEAHQISSMEVKHTI